MTSIPLFYQKKVVNWMEQDDKSGPGGMIESTTSAMQSGFM